MTFDPWCALAALPEITQGEHELQEGVLGLYFADLQTIILRKGLLQAQRRCTLAHELAHYVLGHTACLDRRSALQQETEAEFVAARWMINLDDLAAAEAWGRSLCEVAEELWVDIPMLLARRYGLTVQERAEVTARVWARDEGAA